MSSYDNVKRSSTIAHTEVVSEVPIWLGPVRVLLAYRSTPSGTDMVVIAKPFKEVAESLRDQVVAEHAKYNDLKVRESCTRYMFLTTSRVYKASREVGELHGGQGRGAAVSGMVRSGEIIKVGFSVVYSSILDDRRRPSPSESRIAPPRSCLSAGINPKWCPKMS